MARRFVRLGKFIASISFISFLNVYLFFRYGSLFNYKGLIPTCVQYGDSVQCENELIHALPKIITKIITLKTILPDKDYQVLWDINVAINKMITREGFRRSRKSAPKQLEYSCDETYNGTTYGYPYFIKGFLRTNCKKTHISESTSIIIDRPIAKISTLEMVLNYAIRTFKQVFVIFRYNRITTNLKRLFESKQRMYDKFEIVYIKDNLNLGVALNKILRLLKSPLVLFAPNLERLGDDSDIERLINVHERSGATLVGSAIKNIKTGEWDRGCYQSKVNVHTLKYLPGYLKSVDECLICMHIPGPFIARTDTLRQLQFAKFEAGVYRDLFLRISAEPNKIMACPDVLFYTTPQRERDSGLVEFANKWDITRIVDTDKTLRWFGIRAGFNHTGSSFCKFKKSMVVSPDCRANLLDAILFILRVCEDHKLLCELQEGTLLGALKFNNVLPWERDADITVLSSHFKALSKLEHLFTERDYAMNIVSQPTCCFEDVITGGIMNIHVYGWNIEIYGQHKLTSSFSSRTKVLMGNSWVYTPENPGLYVRNRYGREVYRHAEHWMATGKDTGWAVYDSGYFENCRHKGHHGCLDQFKADGDMQFRSWL